MGVATVQVATAVLISAITAPLIAAWFLRRNGTLSDPDEDGLDERGEPLAVGVGASSASSGGDAAPRPAGDPDERPTGAAGPHDSDSSRSSPR